MSPDLIEAIWSDAAMAVWIVAIALALSGRLAWRGWWSLMVCCQAVTVESLILGQETMLEVCQQCGWLMVALCWWLRCRKS